jgi:protein associated with RNAse G/E
MVRDFLVESRSYDKILRGSWQAFHLRDDILIGDESLESVVGCLRFWLPAGTMMNWASGVRPLKRHCLQLFWPQRWYMFSAFYENSRLVHAYAHIIQPITVGFDRLSFVDLDLAVLVNPDLSYKVLTQAEFDYMASMLNFSDDIRVSALMALHSLTSSIQLSIGAFSAVPCRLKNEIFSNCSGDGLGDASPFR